LFEQLKHRKKEGRNEGLVEDDGATRKNPGKTKTQKKNRENLKCINLNSPKADYRLYEQQNRKRGAINA